MHLSNGGMLDAKFLDAIKQFEGFAASAKWDYAQHTNGYGTRARYPGEVIDRAEAERRFQNEIANAAAFVDRIAPNLDVGSRAALTSLTYNAGNAWTKGELGKAIASGDLDKAREIFVKYNKAGGEILEGLTKRRLAEVEWIGSAGAAAAGPASALSVAASAAADIARSPTSESPAEVQQALTRVLQETAANEDSARRIEYTAAGISDEAKAADRKAEDARALMVQLLTTMIADRNKTEEADNKANARL